MKSGKMHRVRKMHPAFLVHLENARCILSAFLEVFITLLSLITTHERPQR
jgi:hypothetical protein